MADPLLTMLRSVAKQGDFTLSSGKKSDFYLDCREVTLTPQGSFHAARMMLRKVLVQTTAVVGPTTAACPLVTGIGILAVSIGWDGLKLCYIRGKPKEHGTGKLIEGAILTPEDHVVIVDDVATSGGSLLKAAEEVRKTGAEISKALVLVDREEGARERLAKEDIHLQALYTRSNLINT